MKIFYDSEFTGLHQQSTLISIGLVAENGLQFYAEFTDYNRGQCDDWLRENVLKHTRWLSGDSLSDQLVFETSEHEISVCGSKPDVTQKLCEWLENFDAIQIWADCYAYDWVLFCELFGGARNVPNNIHYMPVDLSTLFLLKGLDIDADREKFAPLDNTDLKKHNALYDALIAHSCYKKLITM